MKRILILALLATALLPAVQAHGAPDVLDVEHQVLADEASDATYSYDGYDLTALYVREAYLDQDAFVFRILAAGGMTVGAASEMRIELDVEADGTAHTFAFTTTDDQTWEGDLEQFDLTVETEEPAGTTVNMQVVLPLAAIGLERGDDLEGFALRSYADDALVDAAPGGLYGPTGDAAEVPYGESSRILERFTHDGADGYTHTNVTTDDGLSIAVESLITVSGQHVFLDIGDAPGWQIETDKPRVGEVSASGTFGVPLRIISAGTGGLPITITTDLGGQEHGFLVADGTNAAWADEAPAPQPLEEADEQEAPGLPLLAILATVAAILLLRRR